MYQLIQNEGLKIFKRPGTFVMIGIIVLIVAILGAFMKYQEVSTRGFDTNGWEKRLEEENEALKQQIASAGQVGGYEKEYAEEQLAINQYRIDHHFAPNMEYSLWSFVSDTSNMIDIVGLFSIIIAAGIVASEFNWGTIKLLLIRPLTRSKILLSKYLTVLLFGFVLLGLLFTLSALLGTVLFGFPSTPMPYLSYENGQVVEQSMWIHMMIVYGLKSINILMLTTMAFMISAVFRNSSLAIGLSLFLMFVGGNVTMLIATKYEWAKYILFANTNLLQYIEGKPIIEGTSMMFSIAILFIYFVLFHLLAFLVFQKRDVAA